MSAVDRHARLTVDRSANRIRVGPRWHRVHHVLARWVIEGNWWQIEERREYARIATDQAVIEVYKRGESFHLDRILD